MIRIDGKTRRGFPWKAIFGGSVHGDRCGKIEIFSGEFRCWYDEVIFDPDDGKRVPVIKIYWSDLSDYVRSLYALKPGQSLLITIPAEKSFFFQTIPESEILDFIRAA